MQELFESIWYWIESRLNSLSDLVVALVEQDNNITFEFEDTPARDNGVLVPVEVTSHTPRQN